MFRWVGLGLALIGGLVAVIAIFDSNFELAFIFGIFFIIGVFVLTRPNF